MALAFANLGVSANPDINLTTNVTSYANTSWTPPTSGLIVAFVLTTASTLPGAGLTVTGNSLTWTKITDITSGTTTRFHLFGAKASGSATGVTTITPFETSTGCTVSFLQVTGADEANGVLQTFVQFPTGSGTATSGSITLAAAANGNNRPISGFVHGASEVATPRTSWTEADDLANTLPSISLESQWRADAFENTASASWTTSSAWIGITAEIREARTGPSLKPNIPFVPRGRNL